MPQHGNIQAVQSGNFQGTHAVPGESLTRDPHPRHGILQDFPPAEAGCDGAGRGKNGTDVAAHRFCPLEHDLHTPYRMNYPKLVVCLFLAGSLSACLDLPELDAPVEGTTPPDTGQEPGFRVGVTIPNEPTHTHGSVLLRVEVSQDTPDKVELFVDDQLLATLFPPYTYTWDTTFYTESTHKLVARATKGEQVVSSPERLITVDRTRPRLTSQEPTPGAKYVPTAQVIRAEFSEPMNPNTLTSGTLQLTVNGSRADATYSLSANGTTLNITPSTPITAPSTVVLTLSTGTMDLAGNSLELPADVWTWQLPVWIPVGSPTGVNPSGPAATQPRLRFGTDGQPVMAWTRYPGVSASRWTGTTWESLGTLGVDTTYSFFSRPDLQIDRNNNPVIAWNENSEVNQYDQFHYVRHWINGKWVESEPRLNATGHPSLRLDSNSYPWLATVVASEQYQDSTDVWLSRWTGSKWESFGGIIRAGGAGFLVYDPVLQFYAANFPVIAWNEMEVEFDTHAVKSNKINVWSWTPGGWFRHGGPITAHASGTEAMQPDLQLDKDGNPVIAWAETNPVGSPSTAADIHVRRWKDGRWLAVGPALSATAGNTPAEQPSLALDAKGDPIVAWRESDGSSNKVYVRRWTSSGWQPLNGASSAIPDSSNAYGPSLALNGNGIPFVAWEAVPSGGSKSNVYLYRLNQ